MAQLLRPEDLLNTVKHGAEMIGESFTEPDDDWMQILHVVGEDGAMKVVALMVDNSSQSAVAITTVMRESRAQMVALVQSTWTWEGVGPRPEGQVKDMPGRGEAVTIMFASKEGRMEVHSAKIERYDDRPPTLGPWTRRDDEPEGAELSGRFPDAIKAGFR